MKIIFSPTGFRHLLTEVSKEFNGMNTSKYREYDYNKLNEDTSNIADSTINTYNVVEKIIKAIKVKEHKLLIEENDCS